MLPETLVTFISILEKSCCCAGRAAGRSNKAAATAIGVRICLAPLCAGSLALETRIHVAEESTECRSKRPASTNERCPPRKAAATTTRRLILLGILGSVGDEWGLGGGPRPGRNRRTASE